MSKQIKQLIEKYTDTMNDFKDLYSHWTDSAYWVYRAYERVIQDLQLIPEDGGKEVEKSYFCPKCWYTDVIG